MAAMLLLQSCVEIVEEITVNNDLSGKIDLSLKISQSKGLFGLISQFADLSFFDEIEDEAGKIVNTLKQQPGISHVIFEKDRKSADMRLSFDFDNHKNLNRALYVISGSEKTIFNPALYKLKKHKFVKNNMTAWAKLMMEANTNKLPDNVVFDMIEISTIVHISNPAKSAKGEGVIIYDDRKTVKTSHFISDILEENISTGITIKY